MRAGWVVVAMRGGISPMGVLPLGTHKMGAVFDSRDAAERNCEWANGSAEARATMGMSVHDVAEVLELCSIVTAVSGVGEAMMTDDRVRGELPAPRLRPEKFTTEYGPTRPPSGVDTSRPDDHGLIS